MRKYKLDSLPFPDGTKYEIGHSNGKFAHENLPESKYAVDFLLPLNTPILAAKEGLVFNIKNKSTTYHNSIMLENLPILKLRKLAEKYTNWVGIDHKDGTYSEYLHLDTNVKVKEGEEIKAGYLLGYTGLSGILDRPHLHFNVFETSTGKPVSIPVWFSPAKDLKLYPKRYAFRSNPNNK